MQFIKQHRVKNKNTVIGQTDVIISRKCTQSTSHACIIRISTYACNLRGCLHGGRKILELGRSQNADHSSAICFLYSVYMQEVVLGPSSRIFLVLGSSQLTARKILALGRTQQHVNCLCSEVPGARDKQNKSGGGRVCTVFMSCQRSTISSGVAIGRF